MVYPFCNIPKRNMVRKKQSDSANKTSAVACSRLRSCAAGARTHRMVVVQRLDCHAVRVAPVSKGRHQRFAVWEVRPIPAVPTPAVAPVPKEIEDERVQRQVLLLVLGQQQLADSRGVVELWNAAAGVPDAIGRHRHERSGARDGGQLLQPLLVVVCVAHEV